MTVAIIVILVILLALFFTYTNGFQDGSSVAACILASRVMAPLGAVLLVSIFEFGGAMFGGEAVSHTIQSITSWPARTDLLPVLMSGLAAAIAWNYITRYLRVPSSSTHALVGGVIGALFASSGFKYIVWGHPDLWHPTGVWKVIITLFVSPLAGFAAGWLCLVASTILLARATMHANRFIRPLHSVATATLAFAHGANDPQKAMGIIMLALHSIGLHGHGGIPIYVRLGAGISIVLGVVSLAPGIVKRVSGIYKMRSLSGLCAETASASIVLFGSLTGGPVAASQVIASSVVGVGSAVHIKNVHWIVAQDMVRAWFLTIPCSAVLSCGLYVTIFQWLNRLLY